MSESPKYDDGKCRYDLLDWRFVRGIAEVLTYGAKKYAPDAWQRVSNGRNRYFAAALRHTTAWFLGELNDPESGLPHLHHAATNLMFLSTFDVPEKRDNPCEPPSR